MIPDVCFVCEFVKILSIKVGDLVVILVGFVSLGYNGSVQMYRKKETIKNQPLQFL